MPRYRPYPNPLLAIDPDAQTRSWLEGHRRDKTYADKLDTLAKGSQPNDFFFFSGEMVRYLIAKQGISEKDLNAKLGFSDNYFAANIWPHGYNNGTSVLPEPFRKRMAELTRESLEKAGKTPEEFWCKRNFSLADMDGLFIDMTKDITEAKVQYPKREPSAETLALLQRIPELAKTLLITPATETTPSQWRRDTFLIDADGNFRAKKSMPSLRYLVEDPNHSPEAVVDALTTRNAADGYFHDKGVFMKEVLKTASAHHMVTNISEATRYIPLRPVNSCEWSR